MFRAALFLAPNEKPQCCSVGNWLNKLWYMYTMEYYKARKRNELLIYATIWVSLQRIHGE